MIKKALLSMAPLRATDEMMKLAVEDYPKKIPHKDRYYSYVEQTCEHGIFMRAMAEHGIVKVALFNPEAMRLGSDRPAYELFIDCEKRRFITFDYAQQKWRDAMVHHLEWPRYLDYTKKCWIPNAERELIKEQLAIPDGGIFNIRCFQENIRDEELVRRDKKHTDPWDADMALTPQLPKDWERWVSKVGIPENYIFYQYVRGGAKSGFCSFCGREVPLSHPPRHNQEGTCPRCRHQVVFKSIGRMARRIFTENACVYLIQRRPDGFILREFWAYRVHNKENYKEPELHCTEHLRHIYDADANCRSYYWGDYKHRAIRWIEGAPNFSWYTGCDGYSYNIKSSRKGRIYARSLAPLSKTVLRSTGLLEWLRQEGALVSPNWYLSVWSEIPLIEKVMKANLPQMQREILLNAGLWKTNIVDPKASELTKALGIDGEKLKRLRAANGGAELLGWLQWEKRLGRPIAEEDLQWFQKQHIRAGELRFIQGKMTPLQIRNYLQKQSRMENETIRQVLFTWRDYLSMAEKQGIDTSDEIVYRARKLYQRHDELVIMAERANVAEQAKEIQKSFPKVDKVCKAIKDKYEYKSETYSIVVPESVLDILADSRMLHHCVSRSETYWDRIQKQETYILFLRKTEAPTVPYYTLEVEPNGTIRQKRTKFNRQEKDINRATKFLERWQQVLAKRITPEDKELAAASRVLREEEFKKMREDDVRIHAGDLAGQRLVDVLTADLMETAA